MVRYNFSFASVYILHLIRIWKYFKESIFLFLINLEDALEIKRWQEKE